MAAVYLDKLFKRRFRLKNKAVRLIAFFIINTSFQF